MQSGSIFLIVKSIVIYVLALINFLFNFLKTNQFCLYDCVYFLEDIIEISFQFGSWISNILLQS